MPQSVENICKVLIKDPRLIADCNGFLQAVAARVGNEYSIPNIESLFAGNANSIRGRFGTDPATKPFIYIGKNPDKATELANVGHLVVGGLTSSEMTYRDRGLHQHTAEMGHVVVVAPGGPSSATVIRLNTGPGQKAIEQPARGGYPYCYQGAHNERYRFSSRTQVDAVFPSLLLANVIYAYIGLATK
jgi:hypothetical protein